MWSHDIALRMRIKIVVILTFPYLSVQSDQMSTTAPRELKSEEKGPKSQGGVALWFDGHHSDSFHELLDIRQGITSFLSS